MTTPPVDAIEADLWPDETLAFVSVLHQPSGARCRLYLGTLDAAWNQGATVGRDARNLLRLDDPSIADVLLEFRGASNHRYLRHLAPLPPVATPLPRSDDGTPVVEMNLGGTPTSISVRSAVRLGPFVLHFHEQSWQGQPLVLEAPPPGAPFSVLGPPPLPSLPEPSAGARATAAFLRGLRSDRWLRPDHAVEALAPEARAWICARLDEHHARLGRAAVPLGTVRMVRSLSRLQHAYLARWSAFEGEVDVDEAGPVRAIRGEHDDDWHVRGGVERALAQLGSAASPWVTHIRPALWGEAVYRRSPVAALTMLHANRLFRGDAADDSPWEPLLAIHDRGAWPVALPAGDWCVYVPVRVGDAIATEPGPAVEPEPAPATLLHEPPANVARWVRRCTALAAVLI